MRASSRPRSPCPTCRPCCAGAPNRSARTRPSAASSTAASCRSPSSTRRSACGDAATILELAQFYHGAPRRLAARSGLDALASVARHRRALLRRSARCAKNSSRFSKLRIVAGSDAEALYLGGWLASRLGWTRDRARRVRRPQRASRSRSSTSAAARRGAFTASRSPPATSVYQGSVDEPTPRSCASGSKARTRATCGSFPCKAIDTASLVERAALEERGTDEIFETALRMVPTLIAG